jgi:hypothetical protein
MKCSTVKNCLSPMLACPVERPKARPTEPLGLPANPVVGLVTRWPVTAFRSAKPTAWWRMQISCGPALVAAWRPIARCYLPAHQLVQPASPCCLACCQPMQLGSLAAHAAWWPSSTRMVVAQSCGLACHPVQPMAQSVVTAELCVETAHVGS